MKVYFGLVCSLFLVACSQSTPPSLDRTDEKALIEFNKKYPQNEYEKVAVLRKERLEINPSGSDKSIYNVKYNIAFEYRYDISQDLMNRLINNEKILDPHGIYKQSTGVNKNSFNDGLRIASFLENMFSSKEVQEIINSEKEQTELSKDELDLAKELSQNCKPCLDYINQSDNDQEYQDLKKLAYNHAVLSGIKDGISKIPPHIFAEEIVFFQIEK